MAYAQFNMNTYAPTSTALWRASGAAISAALTTVGLAKTTDTGQVDWTTAMAPSPGTYVYEVRQFSDNVAIGTAIYFKFEMGCDGGTGILNFRITFGTGTDGAGNITGNSRVVAWRYANATSNTNIPCVVSSDGTYLALGLFVINAANYPTALVAGRTRDATGTHTGDGLEIAWSLPTSSVSPSAKGHCFLPKPALGLPRTLGSYHCAAPPEGTGQSGDVEGRFPLFVPRGGADNPTMAGLLIFTNDFGGGAGAGSVITCQLYGVDHGYLFVGPPDSATSVNGNANTNTIAIRYE